MYSTPKKRKWLIARDSPCSTALLSLLKGPKTVEQIKRIHQEISIHISRTRGHSDPGKDRQRAKKQTKENTCNAPFDTFAHNSYGIFLCNSRNRLNIVNILERKYS